MNVTEVQFQSRWHGCRMSFDYISHQNSIGLPDFSYATVALCTVFVTLLKNPQFEHNIVKAFMFLYSDTCQTLLVKLKTFKSQPNSTNFSYNS